jgi:uncharacterized protein YoxC
MQPMYLEISVAALSIVFLLLSAIYITLLIKILQTAKSITTTLHTLNASLLGILNNLEEITANINRATRKVNNYIENLTPAVKRIQGILEMFLKLEHIVREGLRLPFFKTVNRITAVVKGVRVFLDVYRTS